MSLNASDKSISINGKRFVFFHSQNVTDCAAFQPISSSILKSKYFVLESVLFWFFYLIVCINVISIRNRRRIKVLRIHLNVLKILIELINKNHLHCASAKLQIRPCSVFAIENWDKEMSFGRYTNSCIRSRACSYLLVASYIRSTVQTPCNNKNLKCVAAPLSFSLKMLQKK